MGGPIPQRQSLAHSGPWTHGLYIFNWQLWTGLPHLFYISNPQRAIVRRSTLCVRDAEEVERTVQSDGQRCRDRGPRVAKGPTARSSRVWSIANHTKSAVDLKLNVWSSTENKRHRI
ncbi:hypothetical protein KIN20_010772 [Parelaphostrongylus tenuis]|uniref:Uncharacterized protein n=1 Tax=Parelaphostrongylus tenuis TaxID=148309 RepID=A0AAD5QKH4_PARTN|nr:hypothetical protein KIN20_010772 [Parelaphostrongylus tenuis]